MRRYLIICLLSWSGVAFSAPKPAMQKHLQPTVFALTMVMIHDVVNPPAASRFYSYCLLGSHAIVAKKDPAVVAPERLIRQLPDLVAQVPASCNHQMAALYCMLETGRMMLPSGSMLEADIQKLTANLRKEGYSLAETEAARQAGQQVAKAVAAYAADDNYQKLSSRLRYRPTKKDGYWYPTPPGYIEAIEPHWRIIRPMLIDSCSQFKPEPPVPFDAETTSPFGKLVQEVYQTGRNLTPEQRLIASYWDCNPFAINTAGHMSIGFKKISPGGHWINITSQVAAQAKVPFEQAVYMHSLVAMTLRDSFISCWDEKFRSNRIRPETVINRLIDVRWQPLLQTPPFPEYTSGHSVISSAVAEVLTYCLGDSFRFTDTTEEIFELPARSFTSFRQAAEEASVSRLYGGIHFRDAIENGQKQGRAIGRYIIYRVKNAGGGPLLSTRK
ncbi:vanadium-dependent haloperoxidase [Arsenicibacter rosenii]|uniref:Haloperoxidase n=1 Tax=Arsenicibacter rosenii TaxID=1750698 RepID=A0A1S2VF56_9BACT|nr:vanadium-dependent haloperoxidase [Arsenicibacter rosenii]OIN56925.1 haloperoxidase [Arsenicibacter rosenii]